MDDIDGRIREMKKESNDFEMRMRGLKGNSYMLREEAKKISEARTTYPSNSCIKVFFYFHSKFIL